MDSQENKKNKYDFCTSKWDYADRVPKMRTDNIENIYMLPEIRRYKVVVMYGSITMSIHANDDGKEFFVFHYGSQLYGWTDNKEDAFIAKKEIERFNMGEVGHVLIGEYSWQ
jgi:hypothetical protein